MSHSVCSKSAIRPLWIVHLRGTEPEMGAQHGALVADCADWEALHAYYRQLPEMLLVGGSGSPLIDRAARWLAVPVKEWLLRKLDAARPPMFRDRSRAFMEALGAGADEARFNGVMDVFQNAVALAGRHALGPFSRHAAANAIPACTSVMTWGTASHDGRLLHGRNFDFPGVGLWDHAPAVVFCSPTDGLRYGFVTTRGADAVGVSAFNEAGITVTAHTRFHRDVRFDGATVVDIGHAIVRQAESLGDAIRIARTMPSASTWGLAVSSARERRAITLELTGGGCQVVQPCGEHLVCVNRYRHPAFLAGEVAASPAWAEHSDGRERRLDALVESARENGGAGVGEIQAMLADQIDTAATGGPRVAGGIALQATTVKSIVVDGDDRATWVATTTAPTAVGPYSRINWDWDQPVGAAEGAAVVPSRVDAAVAHYVEAARIHLVDHDDHAASRALEVAVAAAPKDASLRFVAGVMALRVNATAAALDHLVAGLCEETAPFRRAQILLWAARCAEWEGQPERAAAWRSELEAMDTSAIGAYVAQSRRDRIRLSRRRRPEVNLMFVDAI